MIALSLLKKVRASHVVALAAVIFAALLGYSTGQEVEEGRSNRVLQDFLDGREKLYEEVRTERARTASLTKSIQDLTDENTQLVDLVAQMKSSPEKIRYITKTETVLVPTGPAEEAFVKPPTEKLFRIGPDLSVARFSFDESTDEPYKFETYELRFKASVVVAENETATLLQAESSAEPGVWKELEVETQESRKVREQKTLEPHFGLGATLAASGDPDLTVAVFSSLIHLHPNVDVLGPRAAFSRRSAYLGIDAAGYNVGSQLPGLNDLWIHAGAAIDLKAQPYATISLGTKL